MRPSCLIALTVIRIAMLRAETFDERHVRDLAANPADLQFRLGVAAIDVTNGGELYPATFRAGGFAASSFDELEAKLRQFPAGARFRWCAQSGNPFDAFSDGQRKEMFDRLSAFLAARSITLEPYAAKKCVPGATR
jgi:hypothetical protein